MALHSYTLLAATLLPALRAMQFYGTTAALSDTCCTLLSHSSTLPPAPQAMQFYHGGMIGRGPPKP